MRELTPVTLVIYMACWYAWGGRLNLHDAIFQTTVLKVTTENQYIMWGTKLIAKCFISLNFTHLVFFAPKEFHDVRTSTAAAPSHLRLLISLYLIIIQQFLNRQELHLFNVSILTAKDYAAQYTNDK